MLEKCRGEWKQMDLQALGIQARVPYELAEPWPVQENIPQGQLRSSLAGCGNLELPRLYNTANLYSQVMVHAVSLRFPRLF